MSDNYLLYVNLKLQKLRYGVRYRDITSVTGAESHLTVQVSYSMPVRSHVTGGGLEGTEAVCCFVRSVPWRYVG